MQITVFGAAGKVGRLVVELALSNNYQVVAFVHSKSLDIKNKDLTVFEGDIYNPQDVLKASRNSDVIISTLGSWGKSNKDVLSVGVTNMIDAMYKNHIKRIITLTGSDARATGDEGRLLNSLSRSLFGVVAKNILSDGEAHIKLLEKTELDWTVLRSPAMNNFGNPRNYRFSLNNSFPWHSINRQSVALAMLELTKDQKYSQKAPFIKRGKA